MRRYLVVANQTLGGQRLLDVVRERLAAGPCHFFVVVPATPSIDEALAAGALSSGVLGAEGLIVPLEQFPEDDGRERAQERLDEALERLRSCGAQADGEVGDSDPLTAIDSVLERRPVDEIILSTLPPGLSRWLKMDLVNRAQRRYAVPVTHVYADEPAPT